MSSEFILGAMWSGKTYYARNKENSLVLTHYRNTRKERDNIEIQPFLSSFFFEDNNKKLEKLDCLIFDEVHLYNVFRDEKKFLETIGILQRNFEHLNLSFSGIFWDCYNKYEPFPIWDEIRMVLREKPKITLLKPRKECFFCGSKKDAHLNFPDEKKDGVVGDHYNSLCFSCWRKVKDIKNFYQCKTRFLPIDYHGLEFFLGEKQ